MTSNQAPDFRFVVDITSTCFNLVIYLLTNNGECVPLRKSVFSANRSLNQRHIFLPRFLDAVCHACRSWVVIWQPVNWTYQTRQTQSVPGPVCTSAKHIIGAFCPEAHRRRLPNMIDESGCALIQEVSLLTTCLFWTNLQCAVQYVWEWTCFRHLSSCHALFLCYYRATVTHANYRYRLQFASVSSSSKGVIFLWYDNTSQINPRLIKLRHLVRLVKPSARFGIHTSYTWQVVSCPGVVNLWSWGTSFAS